MSSGREKQILEILLKEKKVSVHQLAAALFVSEPSVRRDLAKLEHQQLIKRVHGGAVLNENGVSQIKIPFIIRELEHADEKTRIAHRAAALVNDGDVVFLDASSSAYCLVPFLALKRDLTVITSGIKAMTALAEHGLRVISTGGDVMNTCLSLVGEAAVATVHTYYADVCFFSCRGVASNGECSDISREENLVRQAMIERSRRTYLLCTGNKAEQQYYHKLCNVSRLTGILTESPLPETLRPYTLTGV